MESSPGGARGLLILRSLFGFSGASLVQDVVADACTRCTAQDITAHLSQLDLQLDIDGDGIKGALTDGLLILRYNFGFSGESLVKSVVANECARCDAAAISAYLDTLSP